MQWGEGKARLDRVLDNNSGQIKTCLQVIIITIIITITIIIIIVIIVIMIVMIMIIMKITFD